MLRPSLYVSIAGGGPAITYLAGAAAAVDARSRVKGWSGASAGSIVAACKAFGVSDETIRDLITSVLSSGKALSFGAGNIPRGGLFDINIVGDLVDLHLGKNAKMGDATTSLVVCVTDLDRAAPLYLSKRSHPKVLVREAVIASSSFLCGVVPAAQIPSLGTELSPDVRLFGDGGLTDNTVDGVWDGKHDERVSLRLAGSSDHPRLRPGDVAGILAAIPRALMWAASEHKSIRRGGLDIDVFGANDWVFQKSPGRCHKEWAQGYDSAAKHTEWFSATAQLGEHLDD